LAGEQQQLSVPEPVAGWGNSWHKSGHVVWRLKQVQIDGYARMSWHLMIGGLRSRSCEPGAAAGECDLEDRVGGHVWVM
jgi:hypothetical protein